MSQEIAVIGAGISGLASAWLLKNRYSVTIFEKEQRLGGHSNTIEVVTERGRTPVDTGFMVYNEVNYPNLVQLFQRLDVPSQPTEMSFAVSFNHGQLEYSGSNLSALFAQRSRILDPGHWRMLADILRFNKVAKHFIQTGNESDESLGEFLYRHSFNGRLMNCYLLPMGAAIWSCPANKMLAFPARSFLQFFDNHGLLNINDRPQWRTVKGGSRAYVRRMWRDMQKSVDLKPRATSIRRNDDGVIVTTAEKKYRFDHVVLASHADQALRLIQDASAPEKSVLGKFRYEHNRTVLHSDPKLMPVRRGAWSSWNYLANNTDPDQPRMSATYWMNRLQNLPENQPFFVSLNPLEDPHPETVIAEMDYEHPIFDADAMQAQREITKIQGRDRLWFTGSYTGYGFHEDGLRSAIDVCRHLGVTPPWESVELGNLSEISPEPGQRAA